MRINIKPTECTYYVDENNRKVVCVIKNTRDLFQDYISDFNLMLWDKKEQLYEKLLLPTRFVGIATCAEGDTFNKELGKKIAFNKAKAKLHGSFFRRAQFYINEVDEEFNKIIDSFNFYGRCLAYNAQKREQKIEELIQNNN